MQWWRDAKFGMFIHWGVYALAGRGEWMMWNERIPFSEYRKLADQFNPQKFDANAWAEVAKSARDEIYGVDHQASRWILPV